MYMILGFQVSLANSCNTDASHQPCSGTREVSISLVLVVYRPIAPSRWRDTELGNSMQQYKVTRL